MVLGILSPVAAAVHETEYGEDDEGNKRDEHLEDRALIGRLNIVFHAPDIAERSLPCAGFGPGHGAEVKARAGDDKDHDQGKKGVEVIGDGGHEGGEVTRESARGREAAADSGGPAGDRGDDADGRGRGVNDVGELRAGNLHAVRDRAHDSADGQTAEIVVNEDANAKAAGGQKSRAAAADMLRSPAAVGL